MTSEVDGVLKEWGDRLFYAPIRPRAARQTITRTTVVPVARRASKTPARIRSQIADTIRKAPEVMVKISGGGKGMRQIVAHLDYISRNGKVPLENDAGEHVGGRDALSDLKDEWAHGLYGIPQESRRREAFNIILSMPPGTDREAVTRAARAFAQHEFAHNHHYVLATHDDEKHPHVHLCVQAQGIDGTRLNPRKADLQQWREHFADALRDQGVRANATPRTARGVTKRTQRQASLHKAHRHEGVSQTSSADRPARGPQDNFSASQRTALASYRQIATSLSRSPESDDRALALGIVAFVQQMSIVRDLQGRTATQAQPHPEQDRTSIRALHQERDR